ncbi:MAG: type IX secretion system membrane protein PorP/SprF [Bacteroidales bacterium]|nr:type IX secretion system membrane protein PorP/SprF [Bacteroidales bacterium]MCB8999887.1 type IX secretion system membrane protein PorP/SprF [Bacteroidales bacterium]
MRNGLFIFFLFILCTQQIDAQQVPLYSQYTMNGFLLNPAVAGSEGYTAINLTAREQWLGLKDAPKTHALSGQTRLLKNSYISKKSSVRKSPMMGSRSGKVGLGAYVFNDQNGPIDRTGLQLSYAYHIRMRKSQLSFGISGVAYQFSVDQSKIRFEYEDEFWQNAKKSIFIPDANIGVYFSNPKMFAGLSMSQLFQSALKLGEKGYAEYKMKRYYHLIGGYDININDYFSIEPSILIKSTGSFVWQADFNTKFIFNEEYWAGLSYRTGGALIFMGGVRVDKFFFGYAFDYTLSSIMKHSYGSHEFMVALKFGDNARRYRWLNRY